MDVELGRRAELNLLARDRPVLLPRSRSPRPNAWSRSFALDDDWTAFVQSPHSTERYLADVIIEPPLTYTLLAAKLRDLVDAVNAGERPVRTTW